MKVEVRSRLRRGVYVVPTFLTVLNVLFGFISMLLSLRGAQADALGDIAQAAKVFRYACWALACAAVFDTFDGLVARLMKATSEFGKEYDSLADVITFGAAPALLVYAWALHQWGRLGGGIAFLFLVAGSLRLARFNIMTAKTDHRYFIGLPIPAGALTLAGIINYAPEPVTDRRFGTIMLIVTIGVAFAMISTVRYRSQKYSNLQKRLSFPVVLGVVLLLALMLRWPAEAWFLGSICYVSSGPIVKLWSIAFPSQRPAAPQPLAPSPAEIPGHDSH
jgi:CDP-diacylglycerol---serine O-phosphatidyltransferase